ncbi:hypothetical protein M124_0072 [Bacteroides fragilis str. 3988T(B)14]|uniref:Uncharacterized protein n=1 Tax=Bacteroides fragilis str. 3988T(B)14 TaxID=1339315 RepID=A0A015TYU9_BACFG|nr:hypothetical protein M124_0072 [Bacteroides fragilis str. 3988T(B)14]EXY82093.1 hypothetical protein M084_0099 [Bacteroides fragilis str. 3988 T1]
MTYKKKNCIFVLQKRNTFFKVHRKHGNSPENCVFRSLLKIK